MRYGSIYLVVRDFDRSVSFYEKVLDMRVSAVNGKRFAVFHHQGLNLCLMNGYYDGERREQVITRGEHWDIYDDQRKIADSANTRKVFINLGVEDLKAEYERIKRIWNCGTADAHPVHSGFLPLLVLYIYGPRRKSYRSHRGISGRIESRGRSACGPGFDSIPAFFRDFGGAALIYASENGILIKTSPECRRQSHVLFQ